MNTSTLTWTALPRLSRAPWAARQVLRLLAQLEVGHLQVTLPGEAPFVLGRAESGLRAALHVHDWSVFGAALRSGDIGFAQAYIDGAWTTPDLSGLLRLLVANREAIDRALHGHVLGRLAYRLRHLLRRNTRANSRRNIEAHYDLGNAFYRLWLDPTMNYSSAWFQGGEGAQAQWEDLPRAQDAKVARLLQAVGLQAGQRLLEIGCGWGALAEMAAQRHGAHVTGVTLSHEQLAWATNRLASKGLSAQADLRLQDYRDIQADTGFDAICSVEMIEAVGQAFWPQYFQAIKRLLAPGGRAGLQAIVIRDELFADYLQRTDFIQQYIFPGGCLPSRAEIERQAHAAGLRVVDTIAFGPDYGHTCRLWRERFMQQRAAVEALGFDTGFIRTWEFYLAYCEAGFAQGDIDVQQLVLTHA